jgi:hypothetical protein
MFANPSAMGSSEHRRFGNKISLIDAFHNETAVTTTNDLLDCADYCAPALPVPRIREDLLAADRLRLHSAENLRFLCERGAVCSGPPSQRREPIGVMD